MDVDIDIPDNFHVRSSITGPTDIEISSSGGKLIGPIKNPVFNGTVSVRSGKIGLVPQTFEFIEGSRITNGSTSEFDPELNILLRTPDRIHGVLPRDESTVDLEINASLTGTLKNPAFVLSAPNATEILSHEEIMTFLIRNAAFSRAFWGFTFNFHRPHDEDARSISAEYQLRKNMSIKIENNEKGEYGVGFEIKGAFLIFRCVGRSEGWKHGRERTWRFFHPSSKVEICSLILLMDSVNYRTLRDSAMCLMLTFCCFFSQSVAAGRTPKDISG